MSQSQHMDVEGKCTTPSISDDELLKFHEAHFSQEAAASFSFTFMNPHGDQQQTCDVENDEQWEEEEEDDLGYYEDGVKRTLTDEQIAIFRHSEMEALRKEQERRAGGDRAIEDQGLGTSDLKSLQPPSNLTTAAHGKKKKGKKRKAVQREPKPDLRKRTWDVVEKGVDSLDYD